jgi:hypothetical protein
MIYFDYERLANDLLDHMVEATSPNETIEFGNDFETFAQASRSLTGVEDIAKALQLAGGPTSAGPSNIDVGSPTRPDDDVIYRDILRKAYYATGDSYVADADETVATLNNAYKGLGITFEANTEMIGPDEIRVVLDMVNEKGEKIQVESDYISLGEVAEGEGKLGGGALARQKVDEFLKNNVMTPTALMKIISMNPNTDKNQSSGTSTKPKNASIFNQQ